MDNAQMNSDGMSTEADQEQEQPVALSQPRADSGNLIYQEVTNPTYETDFLPGRTFSTVEELQEEVTVAQLTKAIMCIVGAEKEFADQKALARNAKLTADLIYYLMCEGIIESSGMNELQAMHEYYENHKADIKSYKGRAKRTVKKPAEEATAETPAKKKVASKKKVAAK